VGGDEWASRVRRRLSRLIFRRLWCDAFISSGIAALPDATMPGYTVAVALIFDTYAMAWVAMGVTSGGVAATDVASHTTD
jgi:hypothetical protein